MDLISSRLSLKIENLSFISSAFSYLFPYLHHTKRTNVCLLKKKSQRRRQLVVEDGTYRWVKRAKERAWRDWPKIWTMDSSASRRPSETIRIGFDSSNPISSAVADAAMSISRSKDDRIALADMAYFCFCQPKAYASSSVFSSRAMWVWLEDGRERDWDRWWFVNGPLFLLFTWDANPYIDVIVYH